MLGRARCSLGLREGQQFVYSTLRRSITCSCRIRIWATRRFANWRDFGSRAALSRWQLYHQRLASNYDDFDEENAKDLERRCHCRDSWNCWSL